MTLRTAVCAGVVFVFWLSSLALAELPSGPGDWPQWRGPKRDGISTEKGLLKEWPQGGPQVLWQVDTVGVGYSSLAIKDGRIFTQGDLNGVEHVIALSVEDGRVLWAVQPEPAARRVDARVAEALKRIDKNGDGKLTESELLADLGWDFNKYDLATGADVRQIAASRSAALVKELDADGDGRLTFAEAGRILKSDFARIDQTSKEADAAALAKQRAAEMLKSLDADGDGKVSRAEAKGSALDQPFNQADARDPATNKGDELLTSAEIEAYFAQREAGKDGAITQAELAKYYEDRGARGDGVYSAEELRGVFGGLRDGQGDGPRGTPTVDGDRVYAEGGNGDVTCLEAATGKTIWSTNLSSDLGGGRPGWGYSESPLIEGNLVVVTPGGRQGTLAALNKYTGEVVWRSTDNLEGAHYSSPVVANIGGVRQIVQFASRSLFGVTADGGRLLWSYSAANNGTANIATPIVDGDHVFASSAYGTGGGLAKIVAGGGKQQAEEVYFEGKMANHHGGIVKVGAHMYGFGNGGLICMDYLSGRIAWQARSVGKGSLVVADDMLYLLGEGHEVALAEVSPAEYRERGRFKIPTYGRPSWAHPVVAGGRFYIRDQHALTAYDVRAR
jgi:outer membrane protein assembly factor BamB